MRPGLSAGLALAGAVSLDGGEVNLLATSEVRGGAGRGMLGEQRLAGGAAGPAAVQRRAARAETPPPPLCSAVVAARGGRAHVL